MKLTTGRDFHETKPPCFMKSTLHAFHFVLPKNVTKLAKIKILKIKLFSLLYHLLL